MNVSIIMTLDINELRNPLSTHWVIFMFLSSADVFFSISTFLENFFQKYHQNVNSLDPDKTQRVAEPDLGTNCLQRLSVNDNSRQPKGLHVNGCQLS